MQVREKKNALYNQNKLKIAAFCINNYAIPTVSPQVTMPTIEEVVTVAKMADTAGFEGLVPICRWKGYIDERPNHPLNYVLDPFVLAGTLAHATSYSTLFTTLNTPTAHPVFVAKQSATIDRLSGGRFAMNIVGGWNRREFKMFGIDLLEHDERYRYMEEWLEVVRALWESAEEVNHKGKYFDVQGALCRPQPVQSRVPIMNAGLSPTGRAFAAQHSDIAFIALLGNEPENWKTQVDEYRKLAREKFDRELQIYTNITVIQRDTTAEAEAFHTHYVDEFRDHDAVNGFLETLGLESGLKPGTPQFEVMSRIVASGSGYPFAGDAKKIADVLTSLSECGLNGVLINWPDPIEGVSRMIRDVFPILEDRGLRLPFTQIAKQDREQMAAETVGAVA